MIQSDLYSNIEIIIGNELLVTIVSQIAEYQAKQDYGFSLGDQLADKAAAQLAYEIDTEVVQLLDNTAGTADARLTWSKAQPVGVNVLAA